MADVRTKGLAGPQQGVLTILGGVAVAICAQWFLGFNVLSEELIRERESIRIVADYRNPDLRLFHGALFLFWIPIGLVGGGLSRLDLRRGAWSRSEAGDDFARGKHQGLAFLACGVVVTAIAFGFEARNVTVDLGSYREYQYPSLLWMHSSIFKLFIPAGLAWHGWNVLSQAINAARPDGASEGAADDVLGGTEGGQLADSHRASSYENEDEEAELNDLRYAMAAGPALEQDEFVRLALLQARYDPAVRLGVEWRAYDPRKLVRLRDLSAGGTALDADSQLELDELERSEVEFLDELEQQGLDLRELSDLKFELARTGVLDDAMAWRMQLLDEVFTSWRLGLIGDFPLVGLDIPSWGP